MFDFLPSWNQRSQDLNNSFPWLASLLIRTGILHKHAKILLLGLDNAGKSTLFYRLSTDRLGVLQPTIKPNSEELLIHNVRCATFDLGGHRQARRLWRDYFLEVHGIVFLVDAKEQERFGEVRAELDALREVEGLEGVPIMVLGNKIDDPAAVSENELRDALGWSLVDYHMVRGDRAEMQRIELFMCSIACRQGYGDGLRWLLEYL